MTRFVLISDTHNTKPPLPQGEVLIHAGDLTGSGTRKETEAAMQWLGWQALKFEWVVFVGGNHDWFLYHLSKEAGVNAVRQFVRPYGENIIYLEDEFAGVKGASIYGSPVQPEFCNWAWNQSRGAEIRATWDKIPTGIDMLITHGPPYHVLDWVGKDRVGCQDLRDALDRVQPKVHVFGHIHAGHGKAKTFSPDGATTDCYNAAVVNDTYQLDPKHHPWVLEWDGKKFTEVPGIYVI
jgi:Icc-related predicted phosphoesterase